jgi:hypothetical protein
LELCAVAGAAEFQGYAIWIGLSDHDPVHPART